MTIILKNNTGSDITIASLGALVAPSSGQVDVTTLVTEQEFNTAYDSEIRALVVASDITINDGASDLSLAESDDFVHLTSEPSLADHVADATNPHGVDGSQAAYTPNDGADWTDPDPVTVAEALDDIAIRVTAAETADCLLPVYWGASDVEDSTTAVTWQQKLRLSFTSEAADYLVTWFAEIASMHSGTQVDYQVEQDDTTTLSAGNTNPDGTASTGWGSVGGQAKVTLTAATHTFDLDYQSSTTGKQVKIRRGRIVAFKIEDVT